ncbi:MAG: glycosyltransferase [Candidatus Woesearchaeota archaeon]|nr:glycosyltransferase [Candidatus Woesearchaeota archaeon]
MVYLTFGRFLFYTICYFGLYTSVLFFLVFLEHRKDIKNPKPKRIPRVTIVVPAYNERKTIEKTIRSLLNLDYPKEKLEIMVIDDGSEDGTYEIAKKFEKNGVIVIKKPNTGKANTLNFALKLSKGELFGALDADSFVEKSALKKMIGYFDNPKVMAVTPSLKIYKPKGVLQRIQAIEYLLGVYLRKVFGMMGSIHVTPGPFTIYRKSFFEKYGGYDESNLTEDIEKALRIQSKGVMVENVIDANVYTVGPDNMAALSKQRKRWYVGFFTNVMRYKKLFSKSYGNLGVFILPASFVFVALAIVASIYYLTKFATRIYEGISNLVAINFDIWNLFKFNFDAFLIDLSPLSVLALVSLMVSVTMVYIAKRSSKENSRLAFSYVLFALLYLFAFAYWWIIAIICKITKRKIHWGKKEI